MTDQQIQTVQSSIERMYMTMDIMYANIQELQELIQMRYNPETNLWCPPNCVDEEPIQ